MERDGADALKHQNHNRAREGVSGLVLGVENDGRVDVLTDEGEHTRMQMHLVHGVVVLRPASEQGSGGRQGVLL